MALISNPRCYILHAFRFGKDGSFTLLDDATQPHPTEAFACHLPSESSQPRQSWSWSGRIQKAQIVFGQENSQVQYVSKLEKGFPIFRHCEIVDEADQVCDSETFIELLALSKIDNLTYLSFGKGAFTTPIRVCGRLLELAVYLAFFEAKDGADEVMLNNLQRQVLKPRVSNNWDELMLDVDLGLKGSMVSLGDQLAKSYKSVGGLQKMLLG